MQIPILARYNNVSSSNKCVKYIRLTDHLLATNFPPFIFVWVICSFHTLGDILALRYTHPLDHPSSLYYLFTPRLNLALGYTCPSCYLSSIRSFYTLGDILALRYIYSLDHPSSINYSLTMGLNLALGYTYPSCHYSSIRSFHLDSMFNPRFGYLRINESVTVEINILLDLSGGLLLYSR